MSSTPLTGVRLLLVDDDAGVREGLHDFFVDCGAAVVDAGSARAGLSAFIAAPPDVVVSDIRMPPGEDGFWLISAIRALPAGAGGAVPALALSGDPDALDKAAGAGFQAARAKPARLAELVTLVAQLASR